MRRNQLDIALVFPVLAVLVIASFAGGLGVVFMLVEEYSGLEQWGVVMVGLALVVGVPSVAAIAQRMAEKE